jgi:nicotinamide-nucleotide amidase
MVLADRTKWVSMNPEIETWARQLGANLQTKNLMATTAESCTGGGVAYAITDISGSSAWFDRSFITYTNVAKMQMLGVAETMLLTQGAVSQEVVTAMALGALQHSVAQVSVAISGIAGPQGGTADKPVGTIWFAWARSAEPTATLVTECFHLTGNRQQVREQAILIALQGMCKLIQ